MAFEKGINTKVFKSMVVEKAPTRFIGKKYVPDFIGLDKISANSLAVSHRVRLLHKGIGLVIERQRIRGKPNEPKIVSIAARDEQENSTHTNRQQRYRSCY